MANKVILENMLFADLRVLMESEASDQAHALGLKYKGHGYWYDPKTGKTVAQTVKGKLVKVVVPPDNKHFATLSIKKLAQHGLDYLDMPDEPTNTQDAAMRLMITSAIMNGTIVENPPLWSAFEPEYHDDLKKFLQHLIDHPDNKLVKHIADYAAELKTAKNAEPTPPENAASQDALDAKAPEPKPAKSSKGKAQKELKPWSNIEAGQLIGVSPDDPNWPEYEKEFTKMSQAKGQYIFNHAGRRLAKQGLLNKEQWKKLLKYRTATLGKLPLTPPTDADGDGTSTAKDTPAAKDEPAPHEPQEPQPKEKDYTKHYDMTNPLGVAESITHKFFDANPQLINPLLDEHGYMDWLNEKIADIIQTGINPAAALSTLPAHNWKFLVELVEMEQAQWLSTHKGIYWKDHTPINQQSAANIYDTITNNNEDPAKFPHTALLAIANALEYAESTGDNPDAFIDALQEDDDFKVFAKELINQAILHKSQHAPVQSKPSLEPEPTPEPKVPSAPTLDTKTTKQLEAKTHELLNSFTSDGLHAPFDEQTAGLAFKGVFNALANINAGKPYAEIYDQFLQDTGFHTPGGGLGADTPGLWSLISTEFKAHDNAQPDKFSIVDNDILKKSLSDNINHVPSQYANLGKAVAHTVIDSITTELNFNEKLSIAKMAGIISQAIDMGMADVDHIGEYLDYLNHEFGFMIEPLTLDAIGDAIEQQMAIAQIGPYKDLDSVETPPEPFFGDAPDPNSIPPQSKKAAQTLMFKIKDVNAAQKWAKKKYDAATDDAEKENFKNIYQALAAFHGGTPWADEKATLTPAPAAPEKEQEPATPAAPEPEPEEPEPDFSPKLDEFWDTWANKSKYTDAEQALIKQKVGEGFKLPNYQAMKAHIKTLMDELPPGKFTDADWNELRHAMANYYQGKLNAKASHEQLKMDKIAKAKQMEEEKKFQDALKKLLADGKDPSAAVFQNVINQGMLGNNIKGHEKELLASIQHALVAPTGIEGIQLLQHDMSKYLGTSQMRALKKAVGTARAKLADKNVSYKGVTEPKTNTPTNDRMMTVFQNLVDTTGFGIGQLPIHNGEQDAAKSAVIDALTVDDPDEVDGILTGGLLSGTSLNDEQIEQLTKLVHHEREHPGSIIQPKKINHSTPIPKVGTKIPAMKKVNKNGTQVMNSKFKKYGITGGGNKQKFLQILQNASTGSITAKAAMASLVSNFNLPYVDAAKLAKWAHKLYKDGFEINSWGKKVPAANAAMVNSTASQADINSLIKNMKSDAPYVATNVMNPDEKVMLYTGPTWNYTAPGASNTTEGVQDAAHQKAIREKRWAHDPKLLTIWNAARQHWQGGGQWGHSPEQRQRNNWIFTKDINGPPPMTTKVNKQLERGVSMGQDEFKHFIQAFQKGKKVYMGPSGFSQNRSTATNFMGNGPVRCLLRCKPNSKGVIKAARLHGYGYEGEAEIVVGTSRNMIVEDIIKHVRKDPYSNTYSVLYEIVMQQSEDLNESLASQPLGLNIQYWKGLSRDTIKMMIKYMNGPINLMERM